MLNQPSLSEKIILFLTELGEAVDYPKSIQQLLRWEERKFWKQKERTRDQELRQRRRVLRALQSLEKAELLSFDKQANEYRLTPAGWLRYVYYYSRQKAVKDKPVSKNKKKFIVVFDIPESQRRFRDLFRQCLLNRGSLLLQKSVFICPDEKVFTWAQKVVANCHLDGHVKFILADKVFG